MAMEGQEINPAAEGVTTGAEAETENLLALTTKIVTAHLENNRVTETDLPALIKTVHEALVGLTHAAPGPVSAVPIKKSVTPHYVICLEDGTKHKTIKRHLRTAHGMTPEQYRERWGLPSDYPIVAPAYAKARSALAKKIGLGRRSKSA